MKNSAPSEPRICFLDITNIITVTFHYTWKTREKKPYIEQDTIAALQATLPKIPFIPSDRKVFP